MHAVLLTLFIVTGAEPPAAQADQQPYVTPAGGSRNACCDEGGCAASRGGGCAHRLFNSLWDHLGPMPQTCYAPRFGCYPGNNRYMHRYPAFHGYYYREPYNYRHYFDYPWHAQPHEPMGYFTYQKGGPADETLTPTPADGMPPAELQPQAVPSPPPAPSVSQDGWRPVSASRTLRN